MPPGSCECLRSVLVKRCVCVCVHADACVTPARLLIRMHWVYGLMPLLLPSSGTLLAQG